VSNEIKKNCPSCFVLHKPTECASLNLGKNIKWTEINPMLSALANWPANRCLPTIEEFNVARQRYRDHIEKHMPVQPITEFYCGDFNHVMSTHNSSSWLHFFFPDDNTVPTYGPLVQ
jgi:hypothetical protein